MLFYEIEHVLNILLSECINSYILSIVKRNMFSQNSDNICKSYSLGIGHSCHCQ